MLLQQVNGDIQLKALIGQLEKENSRSLYVAELLKVVLQFRYVGWQIYVLRDQTGGNNNNDDDGDPNICLPFHGVLCVKYDPNVSNYIIYCKWMSQTFMSVIKEKVDWCSVSDFIFVPGDLNRMLQTMENTGVAINNSHLTTYVLESSKKLLAIPEDGAARNDHEEFDLKELHEEFAPAINATWKYATKTSEDVISKELKLGKGYGVFVNGHIVSWIIVREYGSMGVLYTRSEYRGRGYASLVVSALSRDLLKLNMTPYANVEKNNDAAAKLFEKLGFEKQRDVFFIRYLPKE